MSQKQNDIDKNKMPKWCRLSSDSITLSIKVQPRASRNKIILPADDGCDFIKICITAPPVESAANEALIKLLSEAFDCPKSSIQILRGNTARFKTVAIYGMPGDKFLEKINKQNSAG